MIKFLEFLNTNEYPILNINIFTNDDKIMITNILFKVYDYYVEETYLRLVTEDGAELVLPKDIEEDFDGWIIKYGNVEISIYIE